LRAPSTAVATVNTQGVDVKASSSGKIVLTAVLAGALALSLTNNIAVAENYNNQINAKVEQAVINIHIQQLIRDLNSNNIAIRKKAVETLYLEDIDNIIPEINVLVPILIRELRKPDNDIAIRIYAEKILGNIGPAARTAAPYLIEALRGKEIRIREYAAEALGNIGPVTNKVIPALLEALGDMHSNVRMRALRALSKNGIKTDADIKRYYEKVAAPAVTKARKALKTNNIHARRQATWDIGNIGPAAKAAVPDLIEALKDDDVDVRINAAWALGRIGSAAMTAVPFLREALKDPNMIVRMYVKRALEKIQNETSMLKQKNSRNKPDIQTKATAYSQYQSPAKASSAGTLNLDNVSTLTNNNLTEDINIANQQGNLNFANILLESLLSSKLIDMNPMLAGEYAKLEKDAIVGIDDAMLPENHLFKTYLKIGTEQLKALEEVYGCTIRLLSQLTTDEIAGKKLIIMSDRTEIKGYEKALYMHLSKQKVESGLLLSPYIGIAKLLLVAREDMVADIVNALNKDGLYSMLFGRPANINEITAFLISGIYELPTPTILNYQADEERHRASLAALIAA